MLSPRLTPPGGLGHDPRGPVGASGDPLCDETSGFVIAPRAIRVAPSGAASTHLFAMLAFVLRRAFQAVLVMLVVAFVSFMLFQYTGDP